MNITKTSIEGVLVIEPTIFQDSRGYFYESYNQERYIKNGITNQFVQDNRSSSVYGTIRGLHYQIGEFAQAKLVTVLRGEVLDVAVDLRKSSPTFGKYEKVLLTGENKKQFLVPRGFAHGFAVLSKEAEFFYKCDNYYSKENERGINFNDSDLEIDWQISRDNIILSDKDEGLPSFQEAEKFNL